MDLRQSVKPLEYMKTHAGEILLRDRAGFRLALRINPTTARVRIIELERE